MIKDAQRETLNRLGKESAVAQEGEPLSGSQGRAPSACKNGTSSINDLRFIVPAKSLSLVERPSQSWSSTLLSTLKSYRSLGDLRFLGFGRMTLIAAASRRC